MEIGRGRVDGASRTRRSEAVRVEGGATEIGRGKGTVATARVLWGRREARGERAVAQWGGRSRRRPRTSRHEEERGRR
jgi:hypothetical protein